MKKFIIISNITSLLVFSSQVISSESEQSTSSSLSEQKEKALCQFMRIQATKKTQETKSESCSKFQSIRIDFRENSREIPSDVTFEGLSDLESWGRWSNAKEVKMIFASPLPESFILTLSGHSYGPNDQKDFSVTIGHEIKKFRINHLNPIVSLSFDKNINKEKTLSITIPEPISPFTLTKDLPLHHQDKNLDSRIIGLGINLLLIQENKSHDSIPVGSMIPFAGITEPEGWLLCDGRSISCFTYGNLYNRIGRLYTNASTIIDHTLFSIPDMRGRVPVGIDGGAGRVLSNNTIASVGGEEKHILLINEMPSHTHPGIQSIHTIFDDTSYNAIDSLLTYRSGIRYIDGYVKDAGGDQPHNNMPPYISVNYIIKY